MRTNIEQRAREAAAYIIESHDTVRGAAKRFGYSKSTIHKDITERLKDFDGALFASVKQVLEYNKAERHLRGGIATRKKYKGE